MIESLEDYNARMNAQALAAWNARLPPLPEIDDMPHISQMLQSKYLVVQDVPQPVPVTIRACIPENQRSRDGHGSETKWVLYFNESRKGMKLNATVIRVLAAAFGEQSEAWIGKRVRLYVDRTVQFGGQTVGGLRLQTPKHAASEFAARIDSGAFASAAAPAASAAPAPGAAFDRATGEILAPPAQGAPAGSDEFDDDIPF